VLTDRGTNFLSTLIKEICLLFKIKQMRTTAYHPQTDGLVERFNRTLIDMLTCYVVDEPEQWERFLPYVTFAYNTAVQSTLKECPFFLFFGRPPVLPNDVKIDQKYEITRDDAFMYTKNWMQAKKLARKHLFKAQEKQKFNYNLGTVETKYEIGDWVMVKAPPTAGKFINRWNGPYKITKNYSKVNYEIENIEDKKQKRTVVHVNRLKKLNQREEGPTETNPNNQQINMENPKEEEKQPNTNPPTVKRGRGRPRKNVRETNESTEKHQMHDIPNRQTQNQTTQTHNQPRRPGRPRSRSNRRNNIDSPFNDPPPWRGRLRSSANTFRGHSQYCYCPRCQILHPERRRPVDDNYPTVTWFLPRHLTIGRQDPCFPYNVSTEQFCINHPNCIHYRQQLRRISFDERPTQFHNRYNFRPRH
jgi:ribosomal protein L21E